MPANQGEEEGRTEGERRQGERAAEGAATVE